MISKMEVERFQAEVLSKIREDFNKERAAYEKKIKCCAEETAILRADVNLKAETIDSTVRRSHVKCNFFIRQSFGERIVLW
jgi:hypothetical protein